MTSQRRRDTGPELALRAALWKRGLRYRVDFAAVNRRRRVDIAFTRVKVAVFVDGCFWHSCPLHATVPKSNQSWWMTKLAANVGRDRATDDELSAAGWAVIRVWEHEPTDRAAERVAALVLERRAALRQRLR
jgi:DNA mismatch endonuclease (patch repair protein)